MTGTLMVRPQSAVAPERLSIEQLKERAKLVIQAGLAPESFADDEKGVSSLALIALKGMDVGMSFMEAVNSFYVVHGRIGEMTHQLVHCLRQHGHDYVVTESTDKRCTVVFYHRNGRELPPFTMTYEEIQEAGWDMQRTGIKPLYAKPATRKIMVRYRAIANGIRAYFPDVVHAAQQQGPESQPPAVGDSREDDNDANDALDAAYTDLGATPGDEPHHLHWSSYPANRERFAAKKAALKLSNEDMLAALGEASGLDVRRVSDFTGSLDEALRALEDFAARQAFGWGSAIDQMAGAW